MIGLFGSLYAVIDDINKKLRFFLTLLKLSL